MCIIVNHHLLKIYRYSLFLSINLTSVRKHNVLSSTYYYLYAIRMYLENSEIALSSLYPIIGALNKKVINGRVQGSMVARLLLYRYTTNYLLQRNDKSFDNIYDYPSFDNIYDYFCMIYHFYIEIEKIKNRILSSISSRNILECRLRKRVC